MAIARTSAFSEKDRLLANWSKALAHPARLAILKSLAARGECLCGTLVVDLPLAQSTVSQHLKALKEAGLIQGEVDGPRSRYCIHRKNFEKLMKIFNTFGAQILEDIKDQSC